MNVALNDFLKTSIDKECLKKALGNNLYNVKGITPMVVFAKDVVSVIEKYISGEITLQQIVDWVNVVWFTDLYEYNPSEEDTIASVMTCLETMDEDGVSFSKEQLLKMIDCLLKNREYE